MPPPSRDDGVAALLEAGVAEFHVAILEMLWALGDPTNTGEQRLLALAAQYSLQLLVVSLGPPSEPVRCKSR